MDPASNKPLVYLDHNILDWFVKGWLPDILIDLRDSAQVVYSAENLQEIARSPEYAPAHLKVLSELRALYMEIVLDEKWKITDKVKWFQIEPRAAYEAQLENKKKSLLPEIDPLYFKLMGGLQGTAFDEIIDEKKDTINSLLKNIDNDEPVVNDYLAKLREKGHSTFEELRNVLKKTIPSSESFNGTKTAREQSGTRPQILNNITGQGVVQRILEKVGQSFGNGLALQKMLNFDNPEISRLTNPNNTIYQKVSAVYTFLEMFGYWSDRRLTREARFKSFMKDQLHVSNAIFTKVLVTGDKGMAMKAGATYEFLGIGTKIFHMEPRQFT